VEGVLLALMRRSMPLTAGQLVASCLASTQSVELKHVAEAAERALEAASSEGRPVERALTRRETRRGRLSEAIAAALTRPGEVAYLAREFASGRER
jgi:hypothetical protein